MTPRRGYLDPIASAGTTIEAGPGPGILAGRYELGGVIGHGASGLVYRARDRTLQREVAVKVLSPSLAADDPASVARFEREAKVAASLIHPAIVTVFDSGADGESRFIVMELVRGRSLASVIRDEAPLDAGRALAIADQIASALVCAHGAGLVHRDIKPGNVMIAGDGSIKVLDFGIARGRDGVSLTRIGTVLGTASYISPEQARGQAADARSDLYSLGCVLYAMLTGRPPFTGDDPAALLDRHVNDTPPGLGARAAALPGLEALVLELLAKAPPRRPASAAELRRRIAKLGPRTGGRAATGHALPGGLGARRTWRAGGSLGPRIAVAAVALTMLAASAWGISASTTAPSPARATRQPVRHSAPSARQARPARSPSPGTAGGTSVAGPVTDASSRGPRGSGPPGHDRKHPHGGPHGHDRPGHGQGGGGDGPEGD